MTATRPTTRCTVTVRDQGARILVRITATDGERGWEIASALRARFSRHSQLYFRRALKCYSLRAGLRSEFEAWLEALGDDVRVVRGGPP
ncbi:MAG TPA: hypothetical protein VFE42_20835 [Chloroflexota bacterium]|nr:hypothetical protein [Chloroflexota bacterium]HZS89925.1 hypothetical protein [Chloroflexota bacterium]